MTTGHQPVLRGPVRQARNAVREEEIAGASLGSKLRLIAMPVIMVAMTFWAPVPVLYIVELCLFIILCMGAAQIALVSARRFRPWHIFVVVMAEICVAGFAMFGPQLFLDSPWTPQLLLTNHTDVYFYLLIALTAFYFSPWLVLWAGAVSIAVWSAGFWWVATLPESITTLPTDVTREETLAVIANPHFVDINVWTQDVLLLALTSVILAAVVWRTRRLLKRQITVARERANLARHFPVTMVDELASHDQPLAQVRSQKVAVMFVDVVGFTSLAERLGPDGTIRLLRELHGRLERVIFENGGTLDKFLGDGVMATFGTPHPGEADARHALEAGLAILQISEDWNAVRRSMKQDTIVLSVGIHYGDVVLGDVGSAWRLEYAVIGDTVNVASRLEELSRELGASLVASQDLLDAAGTPLADGMSEMAELVLRGRNTPVRLRYLPRTSVTP